MTTPELQEKVRRYQSGLAEVPQDILAPKQTQQQPSSAVPLVADTNDDIVYQSIYNRIFSPNNRNYTDEAIESGYGSSIYDSDYVPGMNIEDSRAAAQPWIAKIGAGLVKGTTRAATTAVSTVLGTVAGIVQGITDPIVDYDKDGKRGVREAFDAATNNWVSTQMVKLNDLMEEVVPNYRTSVERSEEYQRGFLKPSHWVNPNNIADFLNNFGFTAGAVLGGIAVNKVIGGIMASKFSSDILKGAVVGAEGDTEAINALKNASEALKKGTAVGVDAEKLVGNIKNVAKRINNASARLQLYGATVGAIGEGTMEGIMAKNEFLEDFDAKNSASLEEDLQRTEYEMLNENDPVYVTRVPVPKSNGEIIEVPFLTNAGKNELEYRKQQVYNKHIELKERALQEGERLATATQLLNIPVLTVSNLAQFGRILSGGWKTSVANAGRVSGGLTKKGILSSAYKATGSKAGKTILNSLKVMGTEGAEEMIQGIISSGEKNVAEVNLASFNDDGYDADVINTFSRDFLQGGIDFLADKKNWQEGFLGAVTGLLGIPGKRWGGGVVGAYQEAKEEINASREAANKLNSLVNNPEFTQRWLDYVRHMKYSNQMSDAVAANDEYAWHTADNKQLIGDVIAFANAGKLNDLRDTISYFENMSEDKVSEIEGLLKTNGKDAEIDRRVDNEAKPVTAERIQKQAKRLRDTIDEYSEIYDALSARAPRDASSEYLQELVATSMEIKSYDERFFTMLDEALNYIDNAALAVASENEDGTLKDVKDAKAEAEGIKRMYERMIAGTLVPVKIPSFFQEKQDAVISQLKDAVKGDAEVSKKLDDMEKLSNARKEFYKKLQYLQTDKGKDKFEEQKVSPEKVVDAADKAAAKLETDALTSLDKVKDAYFSKDNKGKQQFLETLESAKDSNPHATAFLGIKKRYDEFLKYFNEHVPQLDGDKAEDKVRFQLLVEDILGRAESVEDVETLPDGMFRSAQEYIKDTSVVIMGGLPTQSLDDYRKHIDAIRGVMKDFLALDSDTKSRKQVSPTPNPSPVPVTTPAGRDASQPGSVVPPPTPVSPSAVAQALVEKLTGIKQEEKKEEHIAPVISTGDSLAVEEISLQPKEKDDVIAVDSRESKRGRSKPKKLFYRTSVPEIDSGQAKTARAAIAERKKDVLMTCDLADFFRIETVVGDDGKETVTKVNPEYEAIWSALANSGAFKYIANELSVGTRQNPVYIEFVKDKNFPQYNGKDEILVTVVVNGQRQILSTLSHQIYDYYGLDALRKAIDEESKSWDGTNGPFIFSKKAKVIAKRQGLIEYDYSENGEKPIQEIREHSENAPIVFVDRNGHAVFISGNTDNVYMPSALADDTMNRGEIVKEIDRRGALYYLVPSGDGSYIPVRLGVEHLREANKNADNAIFQGIRDSINNIAEIVKASTQSNISDQGSLLSKEVAALGELLDIHDIDIVLKNFDNVGVALAVNTNKVDAVTGQVNRDNAESKMFRPDQISYELLLNFIVSLGRSVNVKYNQEDGTVRNFQSLLDNKLITSNAKMLRAKGVDFYFTAFDPSTGDFFEEEPVASQIIPEKNIDSPEPDTILEDDPDDVGVGEKPVGLDGLGNLSFANVHTSAALDTTRVKRTENAEQAVRNEEEVAKAVEEKKSLLSNLDNSDILSDSAKERILECSITG